VTIIESTPFSFRLAYQPTASSTFLSEQTNHQQSANSTLFSEQTSTSYQQPAERTGCQCACRPLHAYSIGFLLAGGDPKRHRSIVV
jgi:hypothetical protein